MPPKGITAVSLKTWALRNTRPIILCLEYCWALRNTPDLQKSSEGMILKTYQAVALFVVLFVQGFLFYFGMCGFLFVSWFLILI